MCWEPMVSNQLVRLMGMSCDGRLTCARASGLVLMQRLQRFSQFDDFAPIEALHARQQSTAGVLHYTL